MAKEQGTTSKKLNPSLTNLLKPRHCIRRKSCRCDGFEAFLVMKYNKLCDIYEHFSCPYLSLLSNIFF